MPDESSSFALPIPRHMSLKRDRVNKPLFQQALQLFPGGVNSPVRAFRSVGGTPLVLRAGRRRRGDRRRRQPLHRPLPQLGPADPGPRTSCRRGSDHSHRAQGHHVRSAHGGRERAGFVHHLWSASLSSNACASRAVAQEAVMSVTPAGACRNENATRRSSLTAATMGNSHSLLVTAGSGSGHLRHVLFPQVFRRRSQRSPSLFH